MRLAAAALACVLLCGCAGTGGRPLTNGSAVAFEKKVFKLSKVPDPDLEASLEGMLSASYDAAVKEHAGDSPLEIGFSYSLAPHGAAYPFSEIEVSCLMQAKYAKSRGPELCGWFFRELDKKINAALAAKQQQQQQ